MPERCAARAVVVQAPAKLNLFFELHEKRADGYHEIETLMVPVGLFDTLFFEESSSDQSELGLLELECRRDAGPGNGETFGSSGHEIGLAGVPDGTDNLAYRAVALLRERAGVRRGATLRLVKRIPTAAGLGGGSSDASAALKAANRVWGLGWSTAQLAEVAAEVGSDVPFFLAASPAVCRGRGERVEPITEPVALHFVVVRPPVGLSTAEVYRRSRPVSPVRSIAPMLRALRRGDPCEVGRQLFNRLQSAAEPLCPWISRLEEVFQQEDCLGHLMSGSGTCYFGLCRHQRHARRVARRLQAIGVGAVFVVRTGR
ncbi:MAG: 4-(cytidine 5'-diphospho)-2-C-methyl-D-erythritol kinase [Pirellulales bacterium]|nr:4-(cytidine 5'-diphospho)-2-C-methyl-D-erythritol kinase [Pirellulales bacterium]